MVDALAAYIRDGRAPRPATVGRDGQPLVVPICYAYDGEHVYSVTDQKPKRVPPEKLERVRHIRGNPKMSLTIDQADHQLEGRAGERRPLIGKTKYIRKKIEAI